MTLTVHNDAVVLSDEQGRRRVVLDMLAEQTILSVLSPSGKTELSIGVHDRGQRISLLREGRDQVYITSNDEGSAVTMSDAEGAPRVFLRYRRSDNRVRVEGLTGGSTPPGDTPE